MPTSIALSVCSAAPFAGQADADLAVAYVAIFILLFYLTLFPFRGTLLIQRDYTHPPQGMDDEQLVTEGGWSKVKAASQHVQGLSGLVRRRKGGRQQAVVEEEKSEGEQPVEAEPPMHLRSTRSPPTTFSDLQYVNSLRSSDAHD